MQDLTVERYVLPNGLIVLVNTDKQTPLVVVNILYKVGSRNENESKTGFAHLFEHLMFAGSAHADNFDEIVQLAYGENNAYTNTDITNYYINLPAENFEVALWLEADRMQYLKINEQSLEVQRKVVVEEFKQRYLNKPYGDVGHLIRSLIYKKHSYRWPTIGLTPEHITNATLDDVRQFYHQWYCPNNAILSITGNVDAKKAIDKVIQYFGKIPKRDHINVEFNEEPEKTSQTKLEVERHVPSSAIYMAFLMPDRLNTLYHAYDMISDLLGNGPSSRLYQELVKEKKIFQSIYSYISGSIDKGFLMIEGKIHDTFTLQQAEEAIWDVIYQLAKNLTTYELKKVKNKYEANYIASLVNLNNRAEWLAYYEYVFGDYRKMFDELLHYQQIESDQIRDLLTSELIPEKSVILYYRKK
ncbi:MAG: insulinase family protein [Bacteroidales bacterium]|nr:insulinase family protein [Bacteroidales bacterium]